MDITLGGVVFTLAALGFGSAAWDIWKKLTSGYDFRDRKIARLDTLPLNCVFKVRGAIQDFPHVFWVSYGGEYDTGFLVEFQNCTLDNPDATTLSVLDRFVVTEDEDGVRKIEILKEGEGTRKSSQLTGQQQVHAGFGQSKYD